MDSDRLVPTARSHGLIVERLGEETLVYDTDTDRAHSLGPLASSVLDHCDGQSTIAAVAGRLGLPQAHVLDALAELEGCGLLVRDGLSRRDAVRKVAVVGAAAAAGAPLIKSIVAPAPAQAGSPVCIATGQSGCLIDPDCCSNCCTDGTCSPSEDCFA